MQLQLLISWASNSDLKKVYKTWEKMGEIREKNGDIVEAQMTW